MGCNQSRNTALRRDARNELTDEVGILAGKSGTLQTDDVALSSSSEKSSSLSKPIINRQTSARSSLGVGPGVGSEKIKDVTQRSGSARQINTSEKGSTVGTKSPIKGGTSSRKLGSDPGFYEVDAEHDEASIAFILSALKRSAVIRSAIESWNLNDDDMQRIASRAKMFHVSCDFSLPIESK